MAAAIAERRPRRAKDAGQIAQVTSQLSARYGIRSGEKTRKLPNGSMRATVAPVPNDLHPRRHVRQFTGELTGENLARLIEAVSDDRNRVIGLDVLIEPFATEYATVGSGHEPGERLVLWCKEAASDFSTELNITGGFRWEHGSWVVDSFYLVKPGGMFQGTSCLGLIAIDEAALRLNSAVKLIRVSL